MWSGQGGTNKPSASTAKPRFEWGGIGQRRRRVGGERKEGGNRTSNWNHTGVHGICSVVEVDFQGRRENFGTILRSCIGGQGDEQIFGNFARGYEDGRVV